VVLGEEPGCTLFGDEGDTGEMGTGEGEPERPPRGGTGNEAGITAVLFVAEGVGAGKKDVWVGGADLTSRTSVSGWSDLGDQGRFSKSSRLGNWNGLSSPSWSATKRE
jgi:hypothetical protein